MAKLTRRGALAAMAGGAAACGGPVRAPRYDGVVAFKHGVASGDPGLDRVVIWTRVTPEGGGSVPVRWVVAHDRDLRNVAQTGELATTADRDFTVKIDVQGLKPGARYFYGFLCGDARSPVGRTRTLPRGGANALRLGVVSCSNHPFGFFNAYEALSKQPDIDLVLHLGDYIYEYGLNGYGGDVALQLGRTPRPEVEIVTLGDYRLRHAQYKEEPELQAAHAMAPWIVVWDDHEVANDSWYGGAENHNPENTEGDWDARKKAALQAYYEWLPIRDPEPGKPFEAINRSFQWGDLATVIMLETRLLARSQQLDYARDLGPATMTWDAATGRPVPAGAPRPAGARTLPVYVDTASGRPIADWTRVRGIDPRHPPAGVAIMPDIEAFKRGKLADPQRALLGAPQEAWLKERLDASKKAGATWQVIGNQTVMAAVDAPDFSGLPAPVVAKLEALQPGIGRFLQLTRFKPPFNLDAWDGYPAQRARLYDMFAAAGAHPLVVTGDSHTAWANELTKGAARIGAEFACTSVTSPGTGDYVKDTGVDVGQAFVAANRDVKWHDPIHRGFTVLTLKRDEAVAEFFAVSTVLSKDYRTDRIAQFRVRPQDGAGVGPIEKI